MKESLQNIKMEWERLKLNWKDDYISGFEAGCIDVIYNTLDKMIINSEMFNDDIKSISQEINRIKSEILEQ